MKKFIILICVCLIIVSPLRAQTAEVAVSLNDRFFDALLDAIFANLKTPSFPIAANNSRSGNSKQQTVSSSLSNSFVPAFGADKIRNPKSKIHNSPNPPCDESIRLQREVDGVRTAVRFRDGRIFAPIAFSGSYNPPFIGCVDFQGYAETNVELEFDREKQTLVGRAIVSNVVLSGTNGIGSGFVTKIVQSSLDKKINPIQILQTDKLSFLVPIQNADGALRMKANGIRWEISGGVLNVFIAYQFVKA